MTQFASDIKYLRKDKSLPKAPKMTEDLEEKYPDTKKPFPTYSTLKKYLAGEDIFVNSLETYRECGRKAGIATKHGDMATANFETQFFYRMKKLESPENQKLAEKAFKEGYKEGRGVIKPSYFSKKTAGLMERMQQTQKQDQVNMQQMSKLIQGAIDKFRSLVLEVSGTDKVIEIIKSVGGVSMKVFEDKDSPTPSSEKNFPMPEFIKFFIQKLAPRNSQQVAQELLSKGIAEVNKGIFASIKIALCKQVEKNCYE